MLAEPCRFTHNKNIFTVGTCEDDTLIRITLSGAAFSAQGRRVQGIYLKSKEVNGKPSWIMTSPRQALWWYNGGSTGSWMVGDVQQIGSKFGWLRNRVSTLPYVGDGNDWHYSKLTSNLTFVKQNDEINVERECTGK